MDANKKQRMSDEMELWSCMCGDGGIVQMDVTQLVTVSGYFGAMMHCQMRETKDKTIDLQLISADTLNFLLQLFHTNDTKLSKAQLESEFKDNLSIENIEEALKAIDYLLIPCLYPKCSELLNLLISSYCTSVTKVWRIWENCQKYGLESVKDCMYAHIAKNITQMQNLDFFFFHEMPLELLSGVLSMPEIDISSELEIMKLIENWITYFKEARIKSFDTLFKCIHIPSLIHSDLEHIDTTLKSLEITNIEIGKTFSNYIGNPHRFLGSRPSLMNLRNGQTVVMLFGGQLEHTYFAHNLNIPTRRHNMASIPLMYQEVDEICRHCLNRKYEEDRPKVSETVKRKTRSSTPKASTSTSSVEGVGAFGKGLVLKQMGRLKSPIKLVEFGICVYENFVYVTGGQRRSHEDSRSSVKGAYRLDPHLGEWSEVWPMKESRCLFYLCEAWGRLYAVGGANQYGILSSTEYYDPVEDKWYDGPPLPSQLHEHAGCIYDNSIYICGGHDNSEHSNKTWLLRGADCNWTGVAPMLQARSYHAMAALEDHLYVYGGCTKVGDDIKDIYSVEEYDPKTDIWTNILTLNVPISNCLPVVIGTEVLFVGGYSFTQKEYLHQTVAIEMSSGTWKIAPLEFAGNKRTVGYYSLKVKLKKRLLK